jgi:hypothetical protein
MFVFNFTLPARLDAPAHGLPAAGPGFSRHHILGRKYIQLLFALANATEVSNGVLKRFAGWPKPNTSSAIPEDNELERRFFWSPYNLFIGPDGNHRGFDPGSGVEQVCPPGLYREHAQQWEALRAIPAYLESIGVDLSALVWLEDRGILNMTLNVARDQIKSDLTRMIKAVTDTHAGDKVPVYGFHESEWVAVKQNISIERFINRTQDVRGLYDFAVADKLLVGRTWSNRLEGDLFILNPNA